MGGQKRKRTSEEPTGAAERPVIAANKYAGLKWKSVHISPAVLDLEGLLEFEELDDDEVPEASQALKSQHAAKSRPSKAISQKTKKTTGKNIVENTEATFEGFSDEDADILRPESTATVPSSKPADSRTGKHSGDSMNGSPSAWGSLYLDQELLLGLSKQGFAEPTAVQREAVPYILQGRDLIGKAPTGSGKTLAFALPILQRHLENSRNKTVQIESQKTAAILALVIAPTRELAHQIKAHFEAASSTMITPPHTVTVTGGLSIQKQRRLLTNADIVVCTPGRLLEHVTDDADLLNRLSGVRFLVIDEADRLLNEGSFTDLQELLAALDKTKSLKRADGDGRSTSALTSHRQVLVFSATLFNTSEEQPKSTKKSKFTSGTIGDLLKKVQFADSNPKVVNVDPRSRLPNKLEERVLECHDYDKDLYLYSVLLSHTKQRILVFVNSVHAVRRLHAYFKELGLSSHMLHSHMAQKARLRSVERFRETSNNRNVLIATDVAARGLDIQRVDLVIHYNAPRTEHTYIHRCGRTARAFQEGLSIVLSSPAEAALVRRISVKSSAESTETKVRSLKHVNLDPCLVDNSRQRVELAKQVVTADMNAQKGRKEEKWLADFADDFDAASIGDMLASGKNRQFERKKGKAAGDVQHIRAELKQHLAKKNVSGFSHRYLANGVNDVNALLAAHVTTTPPSKLRHN